jgi:ribosomal protein L11 methyltransferase
MYLWRKLVNARWLHANETRLQARTNGRLIVVEQSGRKRLQLEACCDERKRARRLIVEFGGRIQSLPRDWLKRLSLEQKSEPIKIGRRLVVGHSRQDRQRLQPTSAKFLIVPAGAAFGTGDHATTAMSLRLLEETSRKLKPGWSHVDLGTGSGILALAAKHFGAKRVVAIDNDPRAIVTARENARINRIDRIDFRVGDVRRAPLPRKIDIVTANLFSELLIEILPKLKDASRLILSGFLRTQEREVRRALRPHKIDIVEARRRGKWIAILGNCSGAL